MPGRASVVARVPGTGGGRSLALSAHLDIVPEGDAGRWMHPPFGGVIDESTRTIYGRGAIDDRAGVVIAIAVIETLLAVHMPLAGDIVVHFVLENETTGNGTLLCLEAGHRADAAVIIDGTRGDRAIIAHAGQLQFTVTTRGAAAPVTVSHAGVNAAEILCELLIELRQRTLALNESRPEAWRVFPSPFQLSTQRIAADSIALTLPEAASATCYATFPPPVSVIGMQQLIARWSHEFAARRGLEALPDLSWDGFAADPVETDGGEIARVLARVATDLGTAIPVLSPSTGPSDLRHFAAAGIPAMLYGPGRGGNPHRPDEGYRLDDLPVMVRLFVELAAAWCGCAATA